jgi:RimJ/RimL family protein N-acetyltransferase
VEPVELTAGPLLLRPWRDEDLPAVVAASHDRDIARWNGGGASSPDDVAAVLRGRADRRTGDRVSLAVVAAAGGPLLGSVSLHSIDPGQADAEIGYWTTPAARGQGVAVAGVVALCAWAFPALGLDRVELRHAVENPASGRVAAKAGFVLEGRLRRSYRYGDGRKHDELVWSRIADDG